MKNRHYWPTLFSLLLAFTLFLGGCGIPDDARQAGEMRSVTDGMGATVSVPVSPKRVVSYGVSTDDMLIPILGTERIAAIAEMPANLEEAAKIKGRISNTTESIIGEAPDLVIMPSWLKAEFIDEIRSAGIPVYVYKMPTEIEGTIATIHELAAVVGEVERGNAFAGETEDRLRALDDFLKTIPEEKRLICVFARPNGIGGGKGSTFDGLCQHAGVKNGAALYGLTGNDAAGREALISINPDIIFVPSDAYSQDGSNAETARQLYEDPAFRNIKAVQDHRIYIIDAKWLMSYSQFMVNAMEEMAKDAYGYERG